MAAGSWQVASTHWNGVRQSEVAKQAPLRGTLCGCVTPQAASQTVKAAAVRHRQIMKILSKNDQRRVAASRGG